MYTHTLLESPCTLQHNSFKVISWILKKLYMKFKIFYVWIKILIVGCLQHEIRVINWDYHCDFLQSFNGVLWDVHLMCTKIKSCTFLVSFSFDTNRFILLDVVVLLFWSYFFLHTFILLTCLVWTFTLLSRKFSNLFCRMSETV